ncbi:glycosyltransferase [Clostridium sp. YIM B02515]|uniref:Glycosyltransferase n=1 Tax=Clostridium rhizosphaerae TaxID=2803861 RepID=A0ABS1TCJ8_9CLOT|nr:glycosyltransferase [Clostridium rhizosphaerae]MBL4936351.1 glycosyltransferase [Clostridium rhizosphaerae]
MEFSVLMSVYYKENASYLKKAIDSILNQTLRPSEIVIVEDGKLTHELNDCIGEYVINNDGLFKIVKLEKNKGLGEALKIGLLNCSYDIVARMDTDDICRSDRFEKQINYLRNNSNVSIVGSYIAEFEGSPNNIISIRKVPVTYKEVYTNSKRRNPLNHMTVVFRKNDILNSGNYRTFLLNEDYDLWCRVLMNNYIIENIPDTLVYARAGNEMYMRRGGIKYFRSELELQKQLYNSNFISFYRLSTNIILRFTVRILPNRLRSTLYRVFLRKKSK